MICAFDLVVEVVEVDGEFDAYFGDLEDAGCDGGGFETGHGNGDFFLS